MLHGDIFCHLCRADSKAPGNVRTDLLERVACAGNWDGALQELMQERSKVRYLYQFEH